MFAQHNSVRNAVVCTQFISKEFPYLCLHLYIKDGTFTVPRAPLTATKSMLLTFMFMSVSVPVGVFVAKAEDQWQHGPRIETAAYLGCSSTKGEALDQQTNTCIVCIFGS